jgi:hypothetical protein
VPDQLPKFADSKPSSKIKPDDPTLDSTLDPISDPTLDITTVKLKLEIFDALENTERVNVTLMTSPGIKDFPG